MITVYGPSDNIPSTTNETPILGIGQGATDASAGWLLITTLLSKMYDKTASGYEIISPDGELKFAWTHTMFVDDTYLIHTLNTSGTTIPQLQHIVQQDLNA